MALHKETGTGKTTYLARQVRLAVDAYGADGVIVASFTRTAAAELAARDLPLPPNRVGTLHSHCYRALGSPTIAETKIKDFNKAQDVYALSGDGIDLDEPEQVYDTDTDRIFARYQVLRAQMIPAAMWDGEVLGFARAWEGWKQDTGYIDFTDMIELAMLEHVVPDAAIGFFDEVQDFTRLELELVRMWGESMERIVLAGDDDQTLYTFKGATPDAFLMPPVDDDHMRVLSLSYRLPVAVYREAEQWIGVLRGRRQEKEYAPRDAPGEVLRRNDMQARAPEAIADMLIDAASIEREDDSIARVMALTACSYQIAPIVKALRERGALFHNPYRRKRGDWNPLKAARGVTTTQRLLSLLRWDERVHGADARPWTYGDLAEWMPLVRRTGVMRRGQWDKIVEGQHKDQRVSTAALGQFFEDGVLDAIRHSPLDWIETHAASAKAKPLEYPLLVARKQGAARLMDEPRIIVGTIHSVKGGQAQDVFLFPDLSPAGNLEYLNDRTRDNTIRQMYVGMTRAHERLYLCGASTPNSVQWGRGPS